MRKKIFFALTLVMSLILWQRCEYEILRGPVNCEENPVVLELVSREDADCALTDGSIRVAASGGNGSYTFMMDGRAPQTESLFEGLAAGAYQISAIDASNCSASLEVTLKNKSGLNITLESANAGCNGSNGTLTVTATDGIAPYEFKLNDGIFSTDNTFESLSPRDYTLVVKDAGGCTVTQKIKIKSGVSYSTSISGIIRDNCAVSGCHNGSQFPDFRIFKNIHDNASQIKNLTGDRSMPQDGTLTQEQINMIACWVNDGAPDN